MLHHFDRCIQPEESVSRLRSPLVALVAAVGLIPLPRQMWKMDGISEAQTANCAVDRLTQTVPLRVVFRLRDIQSVDLQVRVLAPPGYWYCHLLPVAAPPPPAVCFAKCVLHGGLTRSWPHADATWAAGHDVPSIDPPRHTMGRGAGVGP